MAGTKWGRTTAEFYKSENRLATEHALIDDNGDRLGTPADWFKGVRAVKKSDIGTTPDGAAARHFFLIASAAEKHWSPNRSKQRDLLATRLAALRESKAAMKEDDYYAQMEAVLLELARLTQSVAKAAPR